MERAEYTQEVRERTSAVMRRFAAPVLAMAAVVRF